MDNGVKSYHVTGDWEVFRVPVPKYMECEILYDAIWTWCADKLEGPFKVFNVSYGSSKSFYKNGKPSKTLETLAYRELVQVDIQRKSDAILFKLKWG
jgi:hypothetical protein